MSERLNWPLILTNFGPTSILCYSYINLTPTLICVTCRNNLSHITMEQDGKSCLPLAHIFQSLVLHTHSFNVSTPWSSKWITKIAVLKRSIIFLYFLLINIFLMLIIPEFKLFFLNKTTCNFSTKNVLTHYDFCSIRHPVITSFEYTDCILSRGVPHLHQIKGRCSGYDTKLASNGETPVLNWRSGEYSFITNIPMSILTHPRVIVPIGVPSLCKINYFYLIGLYTKKGTTTQ